MAIDKCDVVRAGPLDCRHIDDAPIGLRRLDRACLGYYGELRHSESPPALEEHRLTHPLRPCVFARNEIRRSRRR
jgi:hypothetical protein